MDQLSNTQLITMMHFIWVVKRAFLERKISGTKRKKIVAAKYKPLLVGWCKASLLFFEQIGTTVRIAKNQKDQISKIFPEFNLLGWRWLKRARRMTYIVYNHTYMSCASLLISFTCLVIEFGQGRHNVGQIIETASKVLE